MDAFLSAFQSIPPVAWLLLAAAVVVTLVLELVKNKFLKEADPKTITALLYVLSLASVGLETVVTTLQANPSILGGGTLAVVGATQFLYRFIVKPATNIAKDAKAYRENAAVLPAETSPDDTEMVVIPQEPVIQPPVVAPISTPIVVQEKFDA